MTHLLPESDDLSVDDEDLVVEDDDGVLAEPEPEVEPDADPEVDLVAEVDAVLAAGVDLVAGVDADFDATIVRDGWAPYRCYQSATHQTCTAHLLRRCHELINDLPAWARHTPRTVRDLLLEGLAARDLDPAARANVVADLAERVELLSQDAHPHDECRKLVAHLNNEHAALFSYLTNPAIDATNWRGEQAIRPAVVNRRVWGGNRTWDGAATHSRIMSVLRTAAQQGVDVIDFLTRYARAPDPAATPLFT